MPCPEPSPATKRTVSSVTLSSSTADMLYKYPCTTKKQPTARVSVHRSSRVDRMPVLLAQSTNVPLSNSKMSPFRRHGGCDDGRVGARAEKARILDEFSANYPDRGSRAVEVRPQRVVREQQLISFTPARLRARFYLELQLNVSAMCRAKRRQRTTRSRRGDILYGPSAAYRAPPPNSSATARAATQSRV